MLPLAEYVCVDSLPSVALNEHALLPRESGIYFVLNAEGGVQYIGRTVNLHARWRDHHRIKQYSKMAVVRIAWLTVSNAALLPSIEKACIAYYQPPDNDTYLDPDDAVNVSSHVTIRVTMRGRELLRLASALSGEKQYEIFDRLIEAEVARLLRQCPQDPSEVQP